jgi:uncharacterized protein YajQ (UPF0234 family)
MPSFDVVSEVDLQEVRNAVDQANRELATRFDFRKVNANFELTGGEVGLRAEQEFHLQQMMDILRQKLVKRQGIDSDTAKDMVKALKASKLKVQAQIQGEQVRVTGKQRDDLQQAMAHLRSGDWGRPIQFTNFRD